MISHKIYENELESTSHWFFQNTINGYILEVLQNHHNSCADVFRSSFSNTPRKFHLPHVPSQGRQFCHRDLQNSKTESVRRQLKWIYYQCKVKCKSHMWFHISVCWNVIWQI